MLIGACNPTLCPFHRKQVLEFVNGGGKNCPSVCRARALSLSLSLSREHLTPHTPPTPSHLVLHLHLVSSWRRARGGGVATSKIRCGTCACVAHSRAYHSWYHCRCPPPRAHAHTVTHHHTATTHYYPSQRCSPTSRSRRSVGSRSNRPGSLRPRPCWPLSISTTSTSSSAT